MGAHGAYNYASLVGKELKKDVSGNPYTEQRLQVKQGFREFKRKHYEEFNHHYTQEQREFVRTVIKDTQSVLEAHGLSSECTCNIQEYLEE